MQEVHDLDKIYRELVASVEDLRSQKNAANDEISRFLKEKKDPKEKIAEMKIVAETIDQVEPQIKNLQAKIQNILLTFPNLPHASVPVGAPRKKR